jgi:hypothetical protein
MLSFFLNPVTMIAGAALVSAPIIIHLINRMRFRRVKWAAMEFLLKAQKRMRRKMIIEQLILLFLRCFLIFLLGLLFARFLGFDPLSGKETRPTVHIVILDDWVMASPNNYGDWHELREELQRYTDAHGKLLGTVSNSFYGDLQVFEVSHPPAN